MNKLQILASFAGVCFGVWPLFMNRSGLNGNVASAAFSTFVLIGVLPFALYSSGGMLPKANWLMVVGAGIFGVLGLLSFNGMLAGASLNNVGTLFVLMTVIQIVLPALYQVTMTGELPITKLAGFVAATIAAYLLL